MAVDPARAKSVFLAASDLADLAERAAYLDEACGGDGELRDRVEALLRANDAAPLPSPGPVEATVDSDAGAPKDGGTREHSPAPDDAAPPRHAGTTDYRPEVEPGLVIAGRYVLQQKLGEGGMGEVWVARQTEPVKRRVALKLIKTGMDSKAVLARFEQERQALAMMDHPNIARVLDGGMTPTGQPFFVMELVNGLPLNKFCDEARLTPKERLEIFVPICQAVQHAHQKGIVHRDLKPANILITMIDGKPVPKVIDFGVAKATAGKLTDESLSTQFGAVVGTLEYMSPEQAGFAGEDIDTRADVYSLGVILYEMLTGLRPIDARRLNKAALTEMIRLIREEEPSKPSTRLSTNDSLPSLAALRQTDPRKLMTILRGELDWVVMKCLEKRRERRYETANALARDIQRYLADEAVEARPPSARYRMGKFVRRHRGQVIAASLVLFALLAGLAAVVAVQAVANETIQGQYHKLESASTTIEKTNAALVVEQGKEKRARQLAENRLQQNLEAVGLFATDARQYCEDALVPGESRARLFEVLIRQLESQVEQTSDESTIDALRNKLTLYQALCAVNHDFGAYETSRKWFEKGLASVAAWEKIRPGDPAALSFRAALLHVRASSLTVLKKLDAAKRLDTEALAIRRNLAGDLTVDFAAKLPLVSALADSLDNLEQFEESIALREKVCKTFEADYQKAAKDAALLRAARERSFPYREALSATYLKAGLFVGDYARRKAYLARSDALSEELIKERRSSRVILLRWATTEKMAGDLEFNYGELARMEGKAAEAKKFFDESQKHFRKYSEISRRLATSNELIDGLRDYSRSFYLLGFVAQRRGDAAQARKDFEQSRGMRELALRDYASSAVSAHLQIDLFFSQLALGEVRTVMDTAENLVFVFMREPDAEYRLACIFAQAIATIEDVRKPAPLTAADKRLQARYRQEAIRCLQVAHDGGFTDFFQTTIDSDFVTIRDDPRMKEFEAIHQYQLGVLAKKRGDAPIVKSHFEKARDLTQEWMKALPKDPRQALVQSFGLSVQVQLGQHAEAIRAANELLPKIAKNRPASYRLACVYSLASAAAADAQVQDRYRTQALALLQQASDGPAVGLAPEVVTEARLVTDEDLDPIRADPRFVTLLERTKKKAP